MDIDSFRALLDAHGGDPARWPETARDGRPDFARTSSGLRISRARTPQRETVRATGESAKGGQIGMGVPQYPQSGTN